MTARPSTIRRGLLATVVAVALIAAACGSDDDTSPTPAAAAEPAAEQGDHTSASPVATAAVEPAADPRHEASASSAAVELRQDMRKLWEDHVTWTRQFIVSAIAELPDTDAAAGRLLQNQADIGAAIATFYGGEAGSHLTELLRGHILVAADLVAAAKAGDTAALEQQQADWDANAVEIAEFLAAANPAWPVDTLIDMMREHLDGTVAEAVARLDGDWEADIAAYDRVHTHILLMADALTAGIIQQFPQQFES